MQDKHTALASTLIHRKNLHVVLDFVITKHEMIDKMYAFTLCFPQIAFNTLHFSFPNIYFRFENQNEIPRILSEIVSLSTVPEEIDRIEKFAKNKKLENMETALKNAKLNLQWSEKNVPIIKDIIKQIHSK